MSVLPHMGSIGEHAGKIQRPELTFTTAAQSYLQVATPDDFADAFWGLYTMLFFTGTPIGARSSAEECDSR